MSNFAHALNLATDLGGFMFTDRSDNRRTDGGEYNAAYINRNNVKQQLDGLRQAHKVKKGASREAVLSYGSAVLKKGLGNCFEISCAGAYTLDARYGVKDWDIVHYDPKGDHIFLAIGDCGDYPDDFASWPDGCAIFDGWAQIACAAPHYGLKWAAKMNEWAGSTPPIELPGPTGGGFGSATAWRDIAGWKKTSYLG